MIDLGEYRARCRALDRNAVRARFLALDMRSDDDVTWALDVTMCLSIGQRKAWLAMVCGITRERVNGRYEWVAQRVPLSRELTARYLDCDEAAVRSLVTRAGIKLAAKLQREAAA